MERIMGKRLRIITILAVLISLNIGLALSSAQSDSEHSGVIIVLDENSERLFLPRAVPLGWLASDQDHAQYEISIKSSLETVSNCHYTDGTTLPLFRTDSIVAISDIETGSMIANKEFKGRSPGGCPETTAAYVTQNRKGEPDHTEFVVWLTEVIGDNLPEVAYEAVVERTIEYKHVNESAYIASIGFSPDGNNILIGYTRPVDTVVVWDIRTGEQLLRLSGNHATYSRDGTLIATARLLDQPVSIWDAKTGDRLFKLQGSRSSRYVDIHPGNKKVIAASDRAASEWDLETGQRREFAVSKVSKAAYSPDGKTIVFMAGSSGYTATVLDAETEQELFEISGHTDFLRSATYSPNGHFIVTASWDGTARIWDAATGAERLVLSPLNKGWNWEERPDGSFIITASSNAPALNWFENANFSPDGHYVIASVDRTARIWDATTGAEIAMLSHPAEVTESIFSPDGSYIATSCVDKIVRVWSVAGITAGGSLQDQSGDQIGSVGETHCTITSSDSVNLRAGPGTSFSIQDTLSGGQTHQAIGQDTDPAGYIWWQLETETWVRSDVVSATGNCETLPTPN